MNEPPHHSSLIMSSIATVSSLSLSLASKQRTQMRDFSSSVPRRSAPGLLLALRGLAAGHNCRRFPHFASFLSACHLNPKTSCKILELHSHSQELPKVA